MKTRLDIKDIFLFVVLTGIASFLISFSSAAQETKKEPSNKATIVVKIKNDATGKTTVIDTSFTLSDPASQKEFEAYMKKFEGDMDEMGEKMENMENMEVMVTIPDISDSMEPDTLNDHMMFIGKGGKNARVIIKKCPKEFSYNFDMPCLPESLIPPGCCEKYFNIETNRDHDMECMHSYGQGGSLSDLLGDIPMSRVKSYSIKDRKNGKRIIIDVEDAPLVTEHDNVIILRNPHKSKKVNWNESPGHDVEEKIIIKTVDDDEKAK